MVNTDKLRGLMAEKRITGEQMADKIGIARKTFYNKMQTGKFGLDEAEVIIQTLHIENPADIFFAKM